MTPTRRILSAASALGLLLALGACASIPDAANPAHWYRSTVDYFSGDDAEAEKKKQEAERQRQRQARAQAQPSQPAQAQPAAQAAPPPTDSAAKRETETGEVADRLARPTRRGLLADSGGRPRYASAVPRQSDDPGAPPSRTAQAVSPAAHAATAEPAPAPRAAVSTAAPPPTPIPPPPAAAPRPSPPPSSARQVAEAAPRPSAPAPAIPTPAPAREPPPSAAVPAPAPALSPMSAAPPPIAAAPPAVTTRALTVEETYRTSLAQQTQLPAAGTAGVPGVPDTLIISSEGLETVRREQSPTRPASAARPGQGVGAALRPGGLGVAPAQSSTVKVATILFADGSSRLDDEARHILGQVAKLHGEQGGTLRVVGHASMRTKPIDPERHAKVNEGVSIARANAVAGQLARLGVQRDTIVVTARGDSEPAYYEVMGTGEAGNRRAEIFLDRNP